MRILKIFSAFLLMYMFITPHIITHAETLEEMKARIRNEVKDRYGASPPLTPSYQQDTAQNVTTPQTRKKASDFSLLPDIDPDTALRFAFVIMLFAVIPAAIARSKGRSFIAWWVLGTLFFVIVMPLSLFLKKEKTHALHGRTGAGSQEKAFSANGKPPKEEIPVDPLKEAAAPSDKKGSAALEAYEKIERLAALKEKGILTEEEFKAKKNELLSRI